MQWKYQQKISFIAHSKDFLRLAACVLAPQDNIRYITALNMLLVKQFTFAFGFSGNKQWH